MADELPSYNTTSSVGGGGDDYKASMSEADVIKLDLLKGLLMKNVNLSDFELGELTGFNTNQIKNIRADANRDKDNESDTPLSWDYVLAFNVGEEDEKRMPTKKEKKERGDDDGDDDEWKDGMTQVKYYGQIFNNFWARINNARLAVEAYRSADKKFMYLVVGITETNLKYWADERDTDLLIDPRGGVQVGRERGFPLAIRTKLYESSSGGGDDNKDVAADADDDDNKDHIGETIDLSNWKNLYGEYSQSANPKVYQHYKRLKTNDDIETVFDEKTRLRIIYESIIADTNEGGAEIKIVDCIESKKHPLIAVFPLHDQSVLDNFTSTWIKNWNPKQLFWCPLEDIRDYFGEPVAFYFGFLNFYLKWLVSPTIIGLIFFIIQLATDEIATTPIPLMCIFVIFWSVAFVDFWLRQESRYRLMWGMTKFETKAIARPQFNGEWTHDAVTGLWTEEFSVFARGFRISTILSGILLFLSVCIASVVGVLYVRDGNPNDLLLKIGLGVANGAQIFVFDVIYKFFSKYGNDWENHRTDQDYQNALINKSFFFKFFNSFASLFYLGFARPGYKGELYYLHYYIKVCDGSVEYMRSFLESISTLPCDDTTSPDSLYCEYNGLSCLDETDEYCIEHVKDDNLWYPPRDGFLPTGGSSGSCPDGDKGPDSDTGYCLGVCTPLQVVLDMNEAVLDEIRVQLLSLFLTAIVIQNSLEVGVPLLVAKCRADKAAKAQAESGEESTKSEAEFQSEQDAYENTIDDMSEMIIQFGYVTLFVMAFPLTPLLALINNIFEMKVDATNLVKTSQRPHPNGSFGLGSWNNMLSFFSYISVLTNVALMTWRTKIVSELFEENSEYKWIFFTVFTFVLSLAVAAEKWLIPDVPMQVEQAVERQRLVESVLILGAAVDATQEAPPGEEDDEEDIKFDPSLEFIDVATLPDIPVKDLRNSKSNKTA